MYISTTHHQQRQHGEEEHGSLWWRYSVLVNKGGSNYVCVCIVAQLSYKPSPGTSPVGEEEVTK